MPILSRLCRLRVISSSLMQSYIITLLLLTVVVLARFTQIYWSHLTKEWAPTIHQADGKFNLAVLCQRASKDFFFLDTVHWSWCYATSLKLSSLKHFWETVALIIDCVLVYLLITAAVTFRMIYRKLLNFQHPSALCNWNNRFCLNNQSFGGASDHRWIHFCYVRFII